uniref:DUF4806 domain-containing protein n=1 Tax=Strongyloides papillosus TaxID=174720 RepID=A0A0N5CAA6_STREA
MKSRSKDKRGTDRVQANSVPRVTMRNLLDHSSFANLEYNRTKRPNGSWHYTLKKSTLSEIIGMETNLKEDNYDLTDIQIYAVARFLEKRNNVILDCVMTLRELAPTTNIDSQSRNVFTRVLNKYIRLILIKMGSRNWDIKILKDMVKRTLVVIKDFSGLDLQGANAKSIITNMKKRSFKYEADADDLQDSIM